MTCIFRKLKVDLIEFVFVENLTPAIDSLIHITK